MASHKKNEPGTREPGVHPLRRPGQGSRRLIGETLGGRYKVVRHLGSGAMGDIFEAVDTRRGDFRVALKLMRAKNPKALVHFKREYRRMEGLSHRNMISYFGLEEHEGRPFIAMELIRGVEFYQALGPLGARQSLDRLRDLLSQLAYGVMYFHHAGLAHRDLKGSNVMVDGQGRLIILDFGLVDDSSRRTSITSTLGIGGTIMYMSPEQMSGQLTRPPSDWYAIGVMLYRALTGSYPFPDGISFAVLHAKTHEDVPRASEKNPMLPDELDELIARLLLRDPTQRASGQDVLGWCSSSDPHRPLAPPQPALPPPPPLVTLAGRERELATLTSSLDRFVRRREFTRMTVCGPSGTGKSALLRCFLAPMRRDTRFIVLKGQCYEADNMAFKAVDQLIDRLAHYLRRLPCATREGLLGEDFRALTHVFPALCQVSRQFATSTVLQNLGLEEEVSPSERRSRAFSALRGLLHRMSAGARLVLVIEDLQWGDLDSIRLLNSVFASPAAPPLIFICTFRDEDLEASPVLEALRDGVGAGGHSQNVLVRTDALPSEDATELARRLFRDRETSERARWIAREAEGNPMLIEALVQHWPHLTGDNGLTSTPEGARLSIGRLTEYWLKRLDKGARALVNIVAVSGQPIAQMIATRAAEVTAVPKNLLVQLRANQLICMTNSGGRRMLEIYHQRVREAVLSGLSPAELARCHRRIAETLIDSKAQDDETLAYHWFAAGERRLAGIAAVEAATDLLRGGVTDAAVRLLQMARICRPGDSSLRVKIARALVSAGRTREAAPLLLEAAEQAKSPRSRRRLRREAGEQWILGGSFEHGLRVLEPLIETFDIRYPADLRGAQEQLSVALAALMRRGVQATERSSAEISSQDLARYDLYWTLCKAHVIRDPVRSGFFALTSAHTALDLGEPLRIVRSLAFAGVVALENDAPCGREWLRVAHRMATSIADRPGEAFVVLCEGVAARQRGEMTEAFEFLDFGLGHTPLSLSWEQSLGADNLLGTLQALGEVAEVANRSSAFMYRAEESGNLDLQRIVLIFGAWSALAADEPERAIHQLERATALSVDEVPIDLELRTLKVLIDHDLYVGAPARAWRRIADRWQAFERDDLLRNRRHRLSAHALRARAGLAVCTSTDRPDTRIFRVVEQDIFLVTGDRQSQARFDTEFLSVSFAALSGGRESIGRDLRTAMSTFDSAGMALHATSARFALAGLSSAAELKPAADFMRLQGVVRPERWLDVLAPGLRSRLR